jgi:serine/threonine-protein kinase
MGRIAQVAAQVARIQQDHLVDIHNFVAYEGIRAIEMEWVDGYDLGRLLNHEKFEAIRDNVAASRWEYLNDVVISCGTDQPRLKPGIAVAILRDCLGALAALHKQGIVHSDVKPSNIMAKRTGSVKIIDVGSAFALDDRPTEHICTPGYAAPEVLDGADPSPQSDLASLGYVLFEMLSGRRQATNDTHHAVLLAGKNRLVDDLPQLLPAEVLQNGLLTELIHHLVHPDLSVRFASAEAAEAQAAQFHQQLVKGDLASEYETEIRSWIEAVG